MLKLIQPDSNRERRDKPWILEGVLDLVTLGVELFKSLGVDTTSQGCLRRIPGDLQKKVIFVLYINDM